VVFKLKDNIIITAALPYANSDLHLGHLASTHLPPDIFYRYLKHRKCNVVQVCASDDFGTPILIAAEKSGKKPSEYVAYWRKRFIEDLKSVGITYEIFYKTSSRENVKLTQHFFRVLYKKGYIYPANVDQFYCQHDKKFLPDRYVKGKCPYCEALDQYSDGCESCGRTLQPGQILEPKCAICSREPTRKKSRHYFFKLSSFSEQLKAWLQSNKNLQNEPKNYVLNWIKEGLQDWDITRDIGWGVKIPFREARSKVLYGWFDNHLCYIASALKQAKAGEAGRRYWNRSTIYHFIGKDIVYHHYLFLPSMRLGEGGYKLPDYIPTRGHLLLQGRKISKSRGWGINIREFLEVLPPDYLRFYLTRITPYSQSDSNFNFKEFKDKINNELVANIGNLVYRSLVFIAREFSSRVPEPNGITKDEEYIKVALKEAVKESAKFIEEGHYDRALKSILDLSSKCNQYFQLKAPWEKRGDEQTTLFYSANLVASLSILLEPFLPFTSKEIWRQLASTKLSQYGWNDAPEFLVKPFHKISVPKPLFRKVEEADLQALERIKS
jgi:methionyl-tRNA synthetase